MGPSRTAALPSRSATFPVAALLLSLSASPLAAQAPLRSLGELEVALYGLSAAVEPASPIVPRQTASGVRVVVRAAGRTLSSAEVARLLGGPFEVRAELTGPGLAGVVTLPRTGAEAIPSPDPLILAFPGLPRGGEYDLSNIRLVRGGRSVLDVQPRRVTLRVIEQILVTSVVTRPLTLDEIRERGVVLDASSYLGFEFAISLRLDSTPVAFRLPVVFDRTGVPIPVALRQPPEPLRSVITAPQFVPVLMRPRAPESDPDGAPPPTNEVGAVEEAGASIPSLLVIPGSVGYLKQFFSAQLIVGNGAPGGSGLVVRDVTGTLRMPPGPDGRAGTDDDPLALPALESGPQSPVVEVRGEGGSGRLLPGEFGRAELTLRGEHEGRHDLDFDIRAKLDGLPVGAVELEGQARGAVLVRNAYFDVTFVVPTVVRADEEFSLFATVTNIGRGVGNDVKLTLDAAALSGARLLSPGTRTIDRVAAGDSRTLEYRLRSEVTGEVVASYLRFDTSGGVNVTGRLHFTLGVGERHVATSPDTLVLPATVGALPAPVVSAALRVLGHAWSAANAATLPPGVERPSASAVFQKGLAVAEAGLRAQLGQPLPEALRDLLLDFHGGLFDPGFDQALRETAAGLDLDRVLGLALGETASGAPLRYEQEAAEVAASGAPFLSVAVESPGGPLAAQVVLADGSGRRTSLSSRQVPTAVVVAASAAPGAPQLGFVPALDHGPYTLHLLGTAEGVVNLSLTRAEGEARQARIDGVEVHPGSRLRVVFGRESGLELEVDHDRDGDYEERRPIPAPALLSRGPQLVSAATIGPETLTGANPFGTYAALLFDRVVSAADAEDLGRYEIARNAVVAARRQLSGRLVFVAFEQPEGPLVPTRLAVAGIRDERGQGGAPQEQPLGSRLVLPGAVVSGRVLQADGSPVADALVTYVNTQGGPGVALAVGVSAQRTDAAGRYELRYVSQEPGGAPFRVETRDPDTGAVRGVKAHVRANGQRLTLDLVLVGHGNVRGTVRHAGGQPAKGARVRVVSVTDSQIGLVATTDDEGAYLVERMTVGPVAVTAVLGANLGRGAGRLDAAGGEATVDVTLDGNVDVTGTVRVLEKGALAPLPGIDVVYYRGGVALGLSVTGADGRYKLLGVPAGPYRLEAGLNTRDKASLAGNSVAGQQLVQDLVIEIRDPASYATVKGTVRSRDGSPVANAWVSDNVVSTRADDSGAYALEGVFLAATPRRIDAVSPDGRRTGSASVLVTAAGQVATGVDIEVSGLGAAVFQVLDPAGAPVAGASVGLQGSCLHPCGCRFATTDALGLARFDEVAFGPVKARAVAQVAPGRWDTAVGTATVASEDGAAGGLVLLEGFGAVAGAVSNPDGLAAHGASVALTAMRFVNGSGACGLQSVTLPPVPTGPDGSFRFEGVHVGGLTVRASSTAFPRVVSASGQVAAAGDEAHVALRLVDTMAGALSGTVLLPDGATPAGPDVEVTASGPLPAVTVRTGADGRYAFARVLPAGSYLLTARDARPEGTGSVVQARVWLQATQDARHDLRLKAKGPVRVTVLDGGGAPVDGAAVRVRLAEGSYPSRRYERTIGAASDQPAAFPEVFEGDFSVEASDSFGRGGRASGVVPPDGRAAEVAVRLTTVGRVEGRLLWPDRTTPLPLGTVRLVAGGRTIGQQTTASEGEVGSFAFDYVPAGQVRLEAEDPRSGRTGTATGTLETEGQVLKLDVVAQAVGRVEGTVTLNGAGIPGPEVALRSGPFRVRVTADAEGFYAVEGVPEGPVAATADLGGGFLAGTARGTLAGEGATLSLNVALHDAGSVVGRLLAADGVAPGAVSVVTLAAAGRRQTTTTDDEGRFRFDLVPEGAVELTADALASVDCARESASVAGGRTLSVDLVLRGVGALEGTATDAAGPVGGKLTVSGTGPGCAPHQWALTLGPTGQYRVPELLAGDVSASLRTGAPGGPPLHASAAGAVRPGETTVLDLRVEPSGRVEGAVVHEDGAPAIGARVRIEGGGGRTAVVDAGPAGAFAAEGMPVGPVTIRVAEASRQGVALVAGLSVPESGTLAVGEIRLVETPFDVVSASPPAGAVDVPVARPVEVAFNAPLAATKGFSVHSGGRGIGFAVSLSEDRRVAWLAPSGAWPDSGEVVVEAGSWVSDVYGRRLPGARRTAFRTVDLSPPRVLSVTPADGAIQVDPATPLTVLFDEPLGTGLDPQSVVRLDRGPDGVPSAVATAGADTLVLTPAAPLLPNARYTVTVAGAVDLAGHVQTAAVTASFTTPDTVPPDLRLSSPAADAWTRSARPPLVVAVSDALVGPDTARAEMRLDGRSVVVTRGGASFQHAPQSDLAEGEHTVEASAHDRAGNRGEVVARFRVDTRPPAGARVEAPAADAVVSGRVTLAGSATDEGGSGVARLRFFRDGQFLVEATSATGLSTSWDTSRSPEGAHRLTVQAVDAVGNAGPPSPPVGVVVNNQAIGVTITAPAEGATAAQQVTVSATPTEPVARVEFRAASGPPMIDDAAPYEATLDVAGLPEGLVVLTATAVGVATETATATRTIRVDRTPPAAPDPARVHAEAVSGSALVVGLPGAVETGARVEVVSPARSARNERVAFADGSFALRVAGGADETIGVVAIDEAGNRSDPLALGVAAADATDVVPRDGLALWARPGDGLVADDSGRVGQWQDASARANDLAQAGPGLRPVLGTDSVSGLPAVRFDGTDDVLPFTARLGGKVRTVFAVVREDADAGTGGRALLGDATTADFYGGPSSWWYSINGPYWQTSPSIVSGQTWVNGAVVDGRATARPKALSVVCVEATGGVTADRLGGGMFRQHWKGDVAELVVFDRPLTRAERKAVEDELALKYAAYVATAGVPELSPNGGSFADSVVVSLATATPGAKVRYTTDGSEPTEVSPLYDGPLTLTASATVRARSFRPGMRPSAVAAVSFTRASDFSPRSVPGLAVWVRGDTGLEADAAGRVLAWRDQSGKGNDLAQATPGLAPLVDAGAAGGLPAVRLDGTDDVLAFTTRLEGTIRTVFAVVREDADAGTGARALLGDATTADFYGGSPSWWYSINGPYWQTSPFIVSGQTWVNGAVVDGRATARPKALSVVCVEATGGVTADRLGGGMFRHYWKGHVAELVVYDRPLTSGERKAVEDHLALKYGAYVATVGAPEFDPNGGTFGDSVAVRLRTPTPGAWIHYTTDGSEPTEVSPRYAEPLVLVKSLTVKARAVRPAMLPSPVATATFTKEADFSPGDVPGLAVWVRGDTGLEADAAGRVLAWRDQSGKGNDLVQATPGLAPLVDAGTAGGLPAVRFDGTDDVLPFTTRLEATIRTVFAVVREDADAGTGGRALLGDATTADFYGGASSWWYSINGPYWQTSPSIVSGQTWVNGAVVDGRATARPKSLSVVCVEATAGVTADRLGGGMFRHYWKGHVAELLVFDRPLANGERKAVEDHLALKYGAYAATVGAPAFDPNGGTFTESVAVRLRTPTPGAWIHYTTDGGEPTEASPPYTGPFVLTATTTVRARAFHASASPSAVATATFTKSADASPDDVPGLALWVRGDAGLEADAAGRVLAWRDQSGRGNDLVPATPGQAPLLGTGAAGGLPAVRFDGTDDFLAFATRLAGTVRTVFAVVWEDADAGTGSRSLLGDAGASDFRGGAPHWWFYMPPYVSTSLAILDGRTWVNGVVVDGKATPRPKAMSVLCVETTAGVTAGWLGKATYSSPWKGHVAELVVYERPLTSLERKSVEDHLALKYAPYAATAGAPEFRPGGGAFEGSVAVEVLTGTPGAAVRYTTDGSEPTEASPLYAGPFALTATTTVRARAFHPATSPSPVSTTTFARAGDGSPASVAGLLLWVRPEVGLVTDGDDRVLGWADTSGRGNHLAPPAAGARPLAVPGAAGGGDAVRFDGVDDALVFASRLTTARSIFWVVREEASAPVGYRYLLGDASAYHLCSGSVRQIWSSSYTDAAVLGGETRLNGARVDGTATSRPTTLSVVSLVATGAVHADSFSRDRTYGRTWWGDLAELVVYDRALGEAERKTVEDHLALKYGLYVPTLAAPRITPGGSVAPVPARATLAAAPGADVRYTTDGSEPTTSSALYSEPLVFAARTTLKARAFRDGWNASPVATAVFLAGEAEAPSRVPGLALWVRADAGVTVEGGLVSAWADQSGAGNHLAQAVPASRPQLVPGEANGLPVVRFDGAGDFLGFTTRLTRIRTVFWVLRRSPSATPGYRFLLGDASASDFTSDSTTRLWSSSASPAVLGGDTRVNGALVDGRATDRPASLALVSLVTSGDVRADAFSRDRANGRSWWGDLAELVVYDRPLDPAEREAVEGYLAGKWALFAPAVSTPTVTPPGGRLASPQVVQLDCGTPGATIRFTFDGTEPVETSPAYAGPFEVAETARVRARAFREGWAPSPEAVATFLGGDAFTPADVPGLALWVRADGGLDRGRVAEWPDQSPAGNDLVQAEGAQRPDLVLDDGSRMPLVRLDGAGDTLLFTRGLAGIRTVFWVVRQGAAATPGYRNLLGDTRANDFQPGSTTKIWSTAVAAAVKSGVTRLDGAPVDGTTTDRPTRLAVISLVTTADVHADAFSRDRAYGRSWWGDLGELVVYDRALSTAEVRAVEEYLAARYGIELAP